MKIYKAPDSIPVPCNYNGDWRKDHDNYMARLKDFCLANGNGALRGETIRFHVADGYAVYMVFGEKPASLIHVPLGDGYSLPYINRLTLADVRAQAKREKAMRELFAKRN